VSNMEASAISNVDGAVMGGMMAALPTENIEALGTEHQGAILATMGADLLDSKGSGFDSVDAVATTFDQVTVDVATEDVQAQAGLDLFSGTDLFGGATSTPSG